MRDNGLSQPNWRVAVPVEPIKNIDLLDKEYGKKIFVDGTNNLFDNKTDKERVHEAIKLVDGYTNREQKWNGKVLLRDNSKKGKGAYAPDDSIELKLNAQNKTVIHEILHTYSAHYMKVSNENLFIEEAVVECLARETCIANNIAFSYNLRKDVEAIEFLASLQEKSTMEFCLELFDCNPNKRAKLLDGIKKKILKLSR